MEYPYGGYSKFKLRYEIFEKFEYRISIWLIFDIQYPISIWWIFDIQISKSPGVTFKFKAKNDFFSRNFEYRISFWWIFDIHISNIEYQISLNFSLVIFIYANTAQLIHTKKL